MPTDQRAKLAKIKRFDQLVIYLHNEMGWPIKGDDFEELTFDYSAEELGIDAKNAAKIEEIKRLRPLSVKQPWGIFFVKFEPKRLPVVALRRILSQVVLKKRAAARAAEQAAWAVDDLLFVSNYGEGDDRRICLAHFTEDREAGNLATLNVLGWDGEDTGLHLDDVDDKLTRNLAWPADEKDSAAWREQWRSAFELRHREVITTSKALAIRLAELARSIRAKVLAALAIETERGKLRRLMKAFQASLIHDLDEASFADMYAQTIAYGLLSARVSRQSGALVAQDAASIIVPVTSPFLRELMETFLNLGGRRRGTDGAALDFDELGISEVVQTLRDANMEAVLRDFGDKNPLEDPVIHFYEHFLAAYDKKLKAQRGVFYTPRPVVSYIVRSVDELLRCEFALEDGLADTTTWAEMARRHKDLHIPDGTPPDQAFVQILDPACGTGTFLVEVIDVVYRTLREKWGTQGQGEKKIDALWNEYVPKHLLPRLHGYELLMAPYAIAHLKIGLKLFETGYRFGSDERARIYLTNTLEPASDTGQMRLEGFLPAIAHEAQAVNEIKREQRFTVVIGNPPYAGHSLNNQVAWIVDKVYDYKRGYPSLQKPAQAKWLQDDYVKFLRFAEWLIEQTDRGVIGFITNHAWLDNPTFKGMRRHFLDCFNGLAVLDLHGNTNKKEMAPDGSTDENVFEIKQGVAVSLLWRAVDASKNPSPVVERAELFGTEARKSGTLMTHTFRSLPSAQFKPLPPELIFANLDDERKREYDALVPIPAIMGQYGDPAPGIVTTHDEFAISFSRHEQIEKVEALLATRSEAQARELFRLCSQGQWNYAEAKKALRLSSWKDEIVPILYRPFDRRVTVYNRHVAVHRRERLSRHMINGQNLGLSIPRGTEIGGGWTHVFCTRGLMVHHAVSLKEGNYLFPLWLEPEWPETRRGSNFSPAALRSVGESTGLKQLRSSSEAVTETARDGWDGRGDLSTTFGPRDLFDFMYAVLHSASYRARYGDFLKSDFARIPLAPTRRVFRDLSRLGREIVSLHLMESPKLDAFITTYTGREHPEVVRVGWSDDTVWLDAAATKKGQPATPGTIGFSGVPEAVWTFHIGGYQVCEKWLKDRKGRTLSKDDIIHYQRIIVALNGTIRLMKEIDEVIEAHGGWPDAFAAGEKAKEATAEKVVAFPVPEQARKPQAKPLRKAAEEKGKYQVAPRKRTKK